MGGIVSRTSQALMHNTKPVDKNLNVGKAIEMVKEK